MYCTYVMEPLKAVILRTLFTVEVGAFTSECSYSVREMNIYGNCPDLPSPGQPCAFVGLGAKSRVNSTMLHSRIKSPTNEVTDAGGQFSGALVNQYIPPRQQSGFDAARSVGCIHSCRKVRQFCLRIHAKIATDLIKTTCSLIVTLSPHFKPLKQPGSRGLIHLGRLRFANPRCSPTAHVAARDDEGGEGEGRK